MNPEIEKKFNRYCKINRSLLLLASVAMVTFGVGYDTIGMINQMYPESYYPKVFIILTSLFFTQLLLSASIDLIVKPLAKISTDKSVNKSVIEIQNTLSKMVGEQINFDKLLNKTIPKYITLSSLAINIGIYSALVNTYNNLH